MDLLVCAVAERFLRALPATAQGVLFLGWILLPALPLHGFAIRIRANDLLAQG